jgi:RNA polymerase sigma-70 factor, ECF subfamily
MDAAVRTTELTERGEMLAGLLGQIARKNEGALAELYDRTSPLVYGLALRMVRERCAAEEITQDVYMHVWRRADTFDPARGNVLSWIATISRSRAIDRLRSSKARLSREENREVMDDFRNPSPDPEHASSESERARFVSRFLSQLPADQRSVIELAFFSALTHSEIASRTGLSLGTTKARIRSGMIQLREQLSFLEGGEPRREE